MTFGKKDYHRIIQLHLAQSWLKQKSKELKELFSFCSEEKSKELISNLLAKFSYLDYEWLNKLLNETADYIINESGFNIETTQILATAYDDEADSSQKVLDMIKIPLFRKGWKNLKTVNHYRSSIKNFKRGRTQLIFIDEFIGSGRTITGRIKQLKNDIKDEFELQCCFLAGISSTIKELKNKGIKIFCALELDRGISDCYTGKELFKVEDLMLDLELKLAQKINNKELYDYSFGFGGAEALYSMEGCNGNTPNSVFPIFWWLKDIRDVDRNTILTRFESGF